MNATRLGTIRRGLGLGLAVVGAVLAVQTCATSNVSRSPGERLHRAKCSACHVRPVAERFDRGDWTEIIAEHGRRVPLTKPERQALIDHLAAPSEQGPSVPRTSAPSP